jgi:F-type H+-transporting ATPase subunit epsilon
MPDPISLQVLTAEGLALSVTASSIVAPGEVGYLGILKNHAPLVSTLKPGKLFWRKESGEQQYTQIGEGLLEVARNRVTILTTRVEQPKAGRAARGAPHPSH